MQAAAPEKPQILVLISGGGTNLQAIIDAVKAEQIDAEICAVVSNRPDVKGLQRAKDAGIEAVTLDHTDYTSREAFDAELIHLIDGFQPDLVVLAGFMRILTADFTRRYEGKMLNIHPSLLPKYRGLKTHLRAIQAGDKEHGVTVHFVTEELDGGPLVIQAIVPVLDDDNPISLAERVQQQEHIIYPLAVKWFCEGRLTYNNGQALMDGQPLPSSGCQLDSRENA
ncbi:phosphoribosylglycinamide formyltransferase [Motiliproteus coralliicola]|uniref:Phosphoribosylglycinamide formyltransferase n=1 Tax=Motiliproteus coralliicola TaxID=2283196 RepID=A0A369WNE5_9GAMM|nr:phosphoribosylglycinamide formyltransferase [Motiliproteus coralliicola]RDE22743.1 phosphoribosylglycinamide formyltransferase [Motiliproteus coralliicola]